MAVYYVEPKGSDSIELLNGMTEYGVIDKAKMFDSTVCSLSNAMSVLIQNGYQVFEEE